MGQASHDKPRLRPHENSPLHFIMECIRVREWELSTFPPWVDPAVVASTVQDIFGPADDDLARGLRHRHIQRHAEFCQTVKKSVEDEFRRLSPETEIPVAIIDHSARERRLLVQTGYAVMKSDTQTRKAPEAINRSAIRRRLVIAMTGLFITYGRGDIYKTAAIATRHTPTKDDHRIAAWWHVRDALSAAARKVGPIRDLEAVALIADEAVYARDIVLRSVRAWDRMRALPEYRRNHERLLASVISSGQLGEWLDETPVMSPDDRTNGIEPATLRLWAHVARVHRTSKRKRAHRTAAVSPSKIRSRNASAREPS